MRDPDERMVYCLEAINKELHEMNKQLKIANQLEVVNYIPAHVMPDKMMEVVVEVSKALDFA